MSSSIYSSGGTLGGLRGASRASREIEKDSVQSLAEKRPLADPKRGLPKGGGPERKKGIDRRWVLLNK
jgi:hypothetical protein